VRIVAQHTSNDPAAAEAEKAAVRASWNASYPDKPVRSCDHVKAGTPSRMLIGLTALGMAELCELCTDELVQATAEYARAALVRAWGAKG
jgi:hypothetical protein